VDGLSRQAVVQELAGPERPSRANHGMGSSELTQVVRRNLLVGGGAAWLLTVGLPAFESGDSLPARLSAGVALLTLLVGVAVSVRWARAGRVLSMPGFIGMCALTWALLGDRLSPGQLQPIRAALGGVAWLTFALGWGAVRHPGAVPENDPRVIPAEPLQPRGELPAIVRVVTALSVGLALVLWLLAWRATGVEHALFAHAIALAAAMWLISIGADIAIALSVKRRWLPPALRLQQGSGVLGTVVLLLLVGVAYWQLGNSR
jgi:hypothetical protein